MLDGAVAVFDGKEGVEPQSETVWRQADKYDVPRICFVNKMDKLGADFYFTVDTIKDRLGAEPLVLQLPIGAENDFIGVIDLIHMRALVWPGDAKGDVTLGAKYEIQEIPADLAEKAAEYRHHLVERVAEADDALMEKYLDGGELTPEELVAGIRKLTIYSELYPVLCGSAFKNRGVQPMLDAVIDYLPSPLDVPAMVGHSRRQRGREGLARAEHHRAVLRARLQGRLAPVLRHADLHPGLLRPHHRGHPGAQRDQGQEGAHREAVPDARQQGEPRR